MDHVLFGHRHAVSIASSAIRDGFNGAGRAMVAVGSCAAPITDERIVRRECKDRDVPRVLPGGQVVASAMLGVLTMP